MATAERLEQMRRYHQAHRAERLERFSELYRQNRAARNAQTAEWNRTHPERRRASRFADNANRRARRYGLPGRLRAAELLALDGPCAYCGAPASGSFDHVRPMFLGGANAIRNVVPSCRGCNARKGRKRLPTAVERELLARYHGPRRRTGSALPSHPTPDRKKEPAT